MEDSWKAERYGVFARQAAWWGGRAPYHRWKTRCGPVGTRGSVNGRSPCCLWLGRIFKGNRLDPKRINRGGVEGMIVVGSFGGEEENKDRWLDCGLSGMCCGF
jgi:hypothetical protein